MSQLSKVCPLKMKQEYEQAWEDFHEGKRKFRPTVEEVAIKWGISVLTLARMFHARDWPIFRLDPKRRNGKVLRGTDKKILDIREGIR